MDSDALTDHLAKLHEELKNVSALDPRSNQLLAEIQKDIQRLLQAPASEAPPTFTGRLENVAAQFEADHPTLAASSRRLIDLLGKAGL